MSTRKRSIAAPQSKVWEVLSDGWLYPLWVVGASRMREVEEAWPAEGSRLHHSVGAWPMLIDDTTEVLENVPGTSLLLKARAWPGGAARVRMRLDPEKGGGTTVTMSEDAVSGPGRLVPSPIRQPGLAWRNTECLRRLAYLAERR